MNITDLSASFYPQVNPQATPAQQIQSQLQHMQQALGNGNLAGAQQSYATLQQATAAPQAQIGNSVAGNSAFATLGQALQSGNIGGARDALAGLLQNANQAQQPAQSSAATSGASNSGSNTGNGGNNTFHVTA
ncbi:hypothetical protein BI364_10545 [Acidihalobacter yilgarnensis]|uniref:Uncharacterized protein n=1 Tax=Acidihalobacter yilgarnensis TaxID=2819280 RepID=A0A1D8IPN0_9GAMM|nr:hypothetical protein [Acidihalobacter yilgarnensis]AOU98344.1 hypothetical protein BI364_10545 [Acidihalobacter yilgarnensis]